jgi:pyrroline-5-carboxylate reductase
VTDISLGIVGGTGWLGDGIARGALESGLVEARRLIVSNRSGQGELARQGVRVTTDNRELVQASDVIMLSVRPDQFDALMLEATGKCVISLMAGVPAARIKAATDAAVVVRAMPNAAVDIRRSFTPWFVDGDLADEQKAFVQRLFESVGEAAEVPLEDHIDYLSALSGTGPAYPALLAQALANQAMAEGIPEAIARRAAAGVVVGSAPLLETRSPEALIDALMAYRGVTAAGLRTLADGGFEALVGRALAAGADVARKGM